MKGLSLLCYLVFLGGGLESDRSSKSNKKDNLFIIKPLAITFPVGR